MRGLHLGWEAAPTRKIGLVPLLDFVDSIDVMLGFVGLRCHFLLDHRAANCSAVCAGDGMLVVKIRGPNWALKCPDSDERLDL